MEAIQANHLLSIVTRSSVQVLNKSISVLVVF